MTERLHFHTLEKEMATHSSVLAWRIPGTGEPRGLPSRRALNDLRKAGLIQTEQRYRENGGNSSLLYELK